MRVRVRLLGKLRRHLPEGADFSSASLDLPPDASVADVLTRLSIGSTEGMVTVNGEKLPATRHSGYTLSDDDEVAVFPPIKGG